MKLAKGLGDLGQRRSRQGPLSELCGMGSPGTHSGEREWEVGELWCWWMETEDIGV